MAQAERDTIAEARTHKKLQEAVNKSSDEDTNDGEEGDADDGDAEEVYQANPTLPMKHLRYNLRKNRTRDYRYRHQHQATIIHYAITQLSLLRGLQKHTQKGERAVVKELKQLHRRRTFRPMHYHKMSEDEKKSVLELLMCMKEKRDGTVKGRGCADGWKQREGTESIETTYLMYQIGRAGTSNR